MAAHFTREQRSLAHRLRAKGGSLRDIAKQICCSSPSHLRVVLSGEQLREGREDPWTPRPGRLTLDEREEIALGLRMEISLSAIARGLGRSPSTVTREVANNGGRDDYRIWPSHPRARECATRPKPAKLEEPVLCAKVTEWLEEFWRVAELFDGPHSLPILSKLLAYVYLIDRLGRNLDHLRRGRSSALPSR